MGRDASCSPVLVSLLSRFCSSAFHPPSSPLLDFDVSVVFSVPVSDVLLFGRSSSCMVPRVDILCLFWSILMLLIIIGTGVCAFSSSFTPCTACLFLLQMEHSHSSGSSVIFS